MQPTLLSKFNIKVGDFEIITNGLIHVSLENSLTIEFDGLTMSFEFLKDDAEGRYIATVDGKTLAFKFFNFDNPLGQGKLEPVVVGSMGGCQLAISFYSWRPNMESESRLLNYVLYRGKEIAE